MQKLLLLPLQITVEHSEFLLLQCRIVKKTKQKNVNTIQLLSLASYPNDRIIKIIPKWCNSSENSYIYTEKVFVVMIHEQNLCGWL